MKDFRKSSFNFSKLTLLSFLISLIIFSVFALSISIPTNNTNSKQIENKPFVSFHNLNESNRDLNIILKEQSLIFDSEPIFISTEWNESSDPFKNITHDALFQDFPPATTLYDRKKLSAIINENPAISSPSDVLNAKFINPFIGINQNSLNAVPLKSRIAYVVIQNLNNSSIVKEYEIIDALDVQINEQLWTPIEFLLIVDDTGPIMPLLVTESSGTEQTDNFFKNYVSKPLLRLGSLPAGYYRISVSP